MRRSLERFLSIGILILSSAVISASPSLVFAVDNANGQVGPTVAVGNSTQDANSDSDNPDNAVNHANDATPDAKAAFQQMLKNYFPLTPNQIQEFKNRAALQAEANASPAGDAPPEGVSSIIQVSGDPGDAMPVLRIGQGMISSLVFTDAAGQVWPITSYSIGDPSAFNVQWDKKSGVMMVQGQKLYAETNMGVVLQGRQIPIMLTLLIGQKSYDYMDTIRIQSYQPGDEGLSDQPAAEAPNYLIKTLQGMPPADSKPLKISGGDAEMWSYDDSYLLLTHATLLSPAWTAKFVGTGQDPLHVYQLSKTPYILLSNNGTLQRLTVTEDSDEDDSNA